MLDTETTGFSAPMGDRIVSLALIELVDRLPTGKFLYKFVNPGRDSSPGALKVHGLTTEFLADKPRFSEIAEEVMDFVQRDTLVAHNAQFDRGFLKEEMRHLGAVLGYFENPWVCTKQVAQKRFGFRAGNRLDDLVARFGIRDLRAELGFHGALIDAILLTAVLNPLYGLPPVIDFDSELIRGILNESGRSPSGQSVAPETKDEAPVGGSAGTGGERTGKGTSGDAGVDYSTETRRAGPTGPAPGAAEQDRLQRGLI